LSEDSIVGPRASDFSPDKDGEAGDVGFIVDAAGCSQAENKPLEARSSFPTEPNTRVLGRAKWLHGKSDKDHMLGQKPSKEKKKLKMPHWAYSWPLKPQEKRAQQQFPAY
jgi:hypothetical protein